MGKNNLKIFLLFCLIMYKITAKFKINDIGLEFNNFSELIALDNYNDIKLLSIVGNLDDHYLNKKEEEKKKRTRIIYQNKWIQYRDGKPGRYEVVPVEIEVDEGNKEFEQVEQEIQKRDFLPDYFSYPKSLVKFVLHGTNIVKLPNMYHLTKLKKIMCLFNRLESCPILPQTVEFLDVSGNPINKLPTILHNLKELKCDSCNLSQITTVLPHSLKVLKCSNNNMKYINYLPEKLEWLDCNTNKLLELPRIPRSLLYLNCSHNNIKGLPGSIFFSKICNYMLFGNSKYQFYHAKVNYSEEKVIIDNNPICSVIDINCNGSLGNYILYKKAVDIIENMFLEAKYNPKYKYCRDRLETEFNDIYTN